MFLGLLYALFFRIVFVFLALSFLYLYSRGLEIFKEKIKFVDDKELESRVSLIKKIKGDNKEIYIPNENADGLEKECQSLVRENVSLSNSISLLAREKESLKNKKTELIAKNTVLLAKLDEAKKINSELTNEKQDWQEKFKCVKTDIDKLKNENVALEQRVK